MLKLEKFKREHFETYQSWFSDERQVDALGDVDEEWLHHVLFQPSGLQLVAIRDQQLVGVAGLILPNEEYKAVYITDISIAPQLTGRGLGRALLEALYNYPSVRHLKYWRAFVAVENEPAMAFFIKNGWQVIQDEALEGELIPIGITRP